jgi:dihydroflavonol-4-reductase
VPILVTGGGGFIGSVVVRQLVQDGRAVRCLLRPASEISRIAGLRFERADGDVRDPDAVRRAALDCAAIVHLAGIVNWSRMRDPDLEEVFVRGTENILAAARSDGARVVYVSSSLTLGRSPTPRIADETCLDDPSLEGLRYAEAKRTAEKLCLAAAAEGLDVVIVNPSEVYGPHDLALTTAGNLVDFAKSPLVLVCDGGTGVVHVEDAARGIIAALDRGRLGHRYVLSAENLSIRELAHIVIELSGQHKRIITLPRWLVRTLGWCGRTLRVPLPFNAEVVPYATSYWFVTSRKAREELGVEFRDARATIASTLGWLEQAGYMR